MTDELIEQVAELQLAAFLAGRGSVTGMKNGTRVAKPAPSMDDFRRMAQSAIAAMQPHIAAEREDAARRALEAAASECEGYAAWHSQHDDGLSGFGHMALGASEIADEIRAIDPAQFREAGNG